MKKITELLFLLLLMTGAIACDETNPVYEKPVKITFEGVDGNTNIIQVDKGVMSYTVKVNISSTPGISSVGIYEVNPKTGVRGTQIGSDTLFVPLVNSCSLEYEIGELTENKAIQLVVTDEALSAYVSNLVIKITPEVIVSDIKIIETAEVYVGPYYASWLNGRCYFRHNGTDYADEIDFSLGNVAVDGTDTVPVFISPDLRQEKGLLYIPGLRACKFALTTLTKANFDAVPYTDASVIRGLPEPMLQIIKAQSGKVFLYENNTERGLIYVQSLAAKTATLEQPDGTWRKWNNNYHELKIITKTVLK